MTAAAKQLQPLLERAVIASEARAVAQRAAARLALLRVVPDLEWFVSDEWAGKESGERVAVWTMLYRMRVWRAGPVGCNRWWWELSTFSGTVVRCVPVTRKGEAQAAVLLAAEAAVVNEITQLEREGLAA